MKRPREKATRKSGKYLPMPIQRKQLAFERFFTQNEFDQISLGLIALGMDDKWLIFLEDMQLNFHRSWTGHCIFQVTFEKREEEYAVTEAWVNRNKAEYQSNDDNNDAALLSFLIDNFLLGMNTPFPLPDNLQEGLPKGVYQHTVAGTAYPESKLKKTH